MTSTFLGVPADGAGYAVMEQLATRGWSIAITAGVDARVCVIATCGDRRITREDDQVAAAALAVAGEIRRQESATGSR